MLLHPVIEHIGGKVTIRLETSFVGDPTDATDKQRIQAYGDPKVNLGGEFVDPGDPAFTFQVSTREIFRGITTEMSNSPVYFSATPLNPPSALDCINADPIRAATVWVTVMSSRVTQAMTALRAKTPSQFLTLPDSTI